MSGFLFFFLLLLLLLAFAKAASPPPFRGGGCTDSLIWFSPCLPYVSSSPNNVAENTSTKCCNAFSSSFAPNSLCFCYLLGDPQILGFPLNTTRLLSLPSLCLSPPPTTSSFDFLCAASPTLPPLTSAETLGIQSPPATAAETDGSDSRSHGAGGGGNGGREGGTAFYFPYSFSSSTSTNTLLLFQLLIAIFFVTLANSIL